MLPRQVIPDLDHLRTLVSKKGKRGWVTSEDYFITTSNGFPWKRLPKVVVGRLGYDNWMVKGSALHFCVATVLCFWWTLLMSSCTWDAR